MSENILVAICKKCGLAFEKSDLRASHDCPEPPGRPANPPDTKLPNTDQDLERLLHPKPEDQTKLSLRSVGLGSNGYIQRGGFWRGRGNRAAVSPRLYGPALSSFDVVLSVRRHWETPPL